MKKKLTFSKNPKHLKVEKKKKRSKKDKMISKKPLHVNLTGLSIFGRLFWKIGRQRLNSAACELFTVPGNLQITTIFGKTSNTTLHILSVCVAITLQEKKSVVFLKIKKHNPFLDILGVSLKDSKRIFDLNKF